MTLTQWMDHVRYWLAGAIIGSVFSVCLGAKDSSPEMVAWMFIGAVIAMCSTADS